MGTIGAQEREQFLKKSSDKVSSLLLFAPDHAWSHHSDWNKIKWDKDNN